MVCEHLAELERELIAAGVPVTFRGQPWTSNCREWVYFACWLDRESIRSHSGSNNVVAIVAGWRTACHEVSQAELRRVKRTRNMNLRPVLLATAALICLGQWCFAVDIFRPGIVHLVVRDESGSPVAGAAVTLTPMWSERVIAGPSVLKTTTDRNGCAEFSRAAVADGAVEWNETLQIEKPEYQPGVDFFSLFVGADIRKEELLKKSRTTVIHVLGPDGNPAPNTQVVLQRLTRMWTNQAGMCRWVHSQLPRGFDASVAGRVVHSPDVADLAIKLSEAEWTAVGGDRKLQGTLLEADGRPAAGWLVGQHCVCTGAGGSTMDPPTNYYQAERLDRVAVDGSFTLSADPELLLVSPEGVPVLYDLNPQTWAKGVRQMTLTVPAVRRVLRGTLVDEKERPLAGIVTQRLEMETRGRRWTCAIATDSPDPGAAQPQIATDSNGRFVIPQYFGARAPYYSFGDSGIFWSPANDSGPPVNIVVTPAKFPNPPPATIKEVILAFVDDSGKPIDGVVQETFNAYRDNKVTFSGVQSNNDARGIHYFLDKSDDRVEIETGGSEWAPARKTFDLTGAADQRIEIKFSAESHYSPVRGKVFDSAGHPVANAQVTVFTEGVPLNRGTFGRDYSWPRTVTDEKGQFWLKTAPRKCNIEVGDFDLAYSTAQMLPRCDPIAVDRDHREVKITLPSAGSIKILLPAGFEWSSSPRLVARSIFAMEAHAAKNDWAWSAQFQYDPATKALIAGGVRVGIYRFAPDAIEELGDPSGQEITVKEGHETVVDWRTRTLVPSKTSWVSIKALAGAASASGAEVSVYARSPQEPGCLIRVTSDLADDAGLIRFRAMAGTQYVAVARQRGRLLGWQKIDAEAKEEQTVSMKPTRMLEIHLPHSPGNSDPATTAALHATVQLLQPTGLERDALLLNAAEGWSPECGTPRTSLEMVQDWKFDEVLEDMPIGATCHIQIGERFSSAPSRKEFDVTVGPGDGPQKITPPGGW